MADSCAADIQLHIMTCDCCWQLCRVHPFLVYPAADALLKIGMRSIPVVIERIETADEKLVIELGAKVIKGIVGRELAEAAVKQAIDKQPDRVKKKNLEEALEFLKPEPPG